MRKSYYSKLLAVFSVIFFSTQIAIAQYTVTGTVTEASTGDVLVGVTIFDAETNSGTSTGIDGEYSLELPAGTTTLRFSSVGFVTKNIEVSGSNGEEVTLDVELRTDLANLEEIVVSGLASNIKRSNLANAVGTVSAEELAGISVTQSVDGALSGKLSGVNIVSSSGAPGGGSNVQLRGISTLGAGSSQPLYVIDGIYVDNSVISTGRSSVSGAGGSSQDGVASRVSDLNPEDIESIEVLKGPSAAAIYGSRANAGVIIITTKRGQAGETRVSIKQDVGFAKVRNLLGFDKWTEEKINLLYSGNRLDTELALFRQNGNLLDYEEEMYGETGLLTNTQISASGGNERTQFYLSAGIQSEEGIIKRTGFDRNNIRLNIDHSINNNISISSSSNYIRTDSDRGFTGNQNGTGGSIGYNIAYVPSYYDLRPDENGNYPNNPYFAENPYAIVDHAVNNQLVNRFLQNLNLEAQLYSDENSFLTFNTQVGFDYLNANSEVYFPEWFQSQQASATPGDVIHGKQDNFNLNLQAFLVHNIDLAGFNFNTQLGYTRIYEESNRLLNRGRGLAPGQTNLNQAQVQSVFGQRFQEVSEIGLVAQEEINWEDKLIGTVGVRFDKSTLNANQNEFYAFPKASLAANLTNFDFWSIDQIDQFKLRTAYGETGGKASFGSTFEALGGVNIGGNLGSVISTRAIDPNLKPETASEIEFGADISAFEGKIGLEATYYIKEVRDLILDQSPPASTGISAIATNAADLENKGWELTLTSSPVRSSNLSWMTKLMYWKNDSEITRLDIPSFETGGFGLSLGQYLIREGFSPTTIVGNPQDPGLTFYGNAQPDYQMSWYNELNFMSNFDLSFLFQYSKGADNINLTSFLLDGGGNTPDWSDDDDGDGTPNGLDRGPFNPSRFVEDATFLKLREVGLYYTVPADVVDGLLNVERIRLGVSGSNLFVITDYTSYDPEVSNFGAQPIAQSVEVTPYPNSRRVFFHINLDF
ncbi:SusC/RagA family TonB-linked outer membrane protein [Gracilimonas sp.]|uniref:SusC/RagA family TonB-linked outer membrane protein n=1 Tax=Gracilimonas sp. TaxID=1974203 RepID=UPI002870C4D6|nr:SusC/RagA family TonB-linked outer membrane protein [Gracilimonas sp.]